MKIREALIEAFKEAGEELPSKPQGSKTSKQEYQNSNSSKQSGSTVPSHKPRNTDHKSSKSYRKRQPRPAKKNRSQESHSSVSSKPFNLKVDAEAEPKFGASQKTSQPKLLLFNESGKKSSIEPSEPGKQVDQEIFYSGSRNQDNRLR